VELRTRSKRWWLTPLRLLVSVALLSLLFTQVGDEVTWSTLLPTWTPETLGWLAGAAGLMLVSYLLSTVRWQQVVRALDLRDRFRRLLSHFMAGQFISNALPTTIGGDVIRVARLSKDTDDAPGSFASVVLERLTGWIVLPVITLTAFVINPELRDLGRQTTVALSIAAGTLIVLVVLLYAVNHDRLGGRFKDSDGWRRFAGAVHLGFGRLRRHPQAAISVILAGFVYQFVLILMAFMTAKSLGIDVGITALMAFFPAVLIAQVLPISIAGLGVREFMLVWLLSAVGVPEEQALALGIVIWVITVVTSLTGAPAYATGGGRPSPQAAEVLA
jgi:uncharacterized membrane protein YbhN (UPF0104 family)